MSNEGLKAALCLTLGMFIGSFFQLPHYYWILVTVAVIYLVGGFGGLKIQKINKRILGTAIGLSLGIFYMVALGYYSYKALYVVPLAVFFMLYLFLITEDYTYMAIFVSITLILTISILTPVDVSWNIYDVAFSRVVGTVIGILIIILVDYFLFHKSIKTENRINPEFVIVYSLFRDLVNELADRFVNNENVDNKFREKYFKFYDNIDRTRVLLKSIEIEIGSDKNKLNIYKELYKNFYSALDCIREMIFILSHNNYKTVNKKSFSKLVKLLDEELVPELKHRKTMNLLSQMKINCLNKKRFNPEFYFLEAFVNLGNYILEIDNLRQSLSLQKKS